MYGGMHKIPYFLIMRTFILLHSLIMRNINFNISSETKKVLENIRLLKLFSNQKITGVNDTVVVLLFLFKLDSKKRTQIIVNAAIRTNKIVENLIYSPAASLRGFGTFFYHW